MALDVCGRFQDVISRNPSLKDVPLVGIIKEVAPTKSVETDEKLGVTVFQENYFQNRPLYLDEQRNFYELLGNRKLSISFASFLKPWKLYADFKMLTARIKAKKIDGNFAGEGLVQGGIIVFGPGSDEIIYQYQEETGSEVPLDALEAGMLKLLTCRP
jgi:hypothetical protein